MELDFALIGLLYVLQLQLVHLGKLLLLVSQSLLNTSPDFFTFDLGVLPCELFLLEESKLFGFLELDDFCSHTSFGLRVVFLLCGLNFELVRLIDIINLFLLGPSQGLPDNFDLHVLLA